MTNPFAELEGIVTSKWDVFKTCIAMIKLEAKLAGLSVFPLLVNLCMLLVVLATIWLAAMLGLGYGLMLFFHQIFIALGSVVFFNLIIFVLLLKYMQFNLNMMSFEKTRQYLGVGSEEAINEQTRIDQSKNSAGKEVTTSASPSDVT